MLVRVERQLERRERELRVPGAAQRAAGLQHVDLHVSVSALETRDQRFFKLGARAAEEVDQVAVIAHAGLIEAVADVVLEVDGLAVGRVLVAGAVKVRDARDVLVKNVGQTDRDGVVLERGQGHVARVEVPERGQDALASERGRVAEDARQHHGLVAHHGLIAFADDVLVFLGARSPDPGFHVAGVLIQHVVDAFVEPAPHRGIGLGVEAGRQRFKYPGAVAAIVHFPVIPAP